MKSLLNQSQANLDEQFALDDEFVNRINSIPGITWRAKKHRYFSKTKLKDLKRIQLSDIDMSRYPLKKYLNDIKLPKVYDFRREYPECVQRVRDQASCGGCWAFSVAYSLSDRLCQQTKSQIKVELSAQYQISCNSRAGGCGGGVLQNVWEFIEDLGTVSEECWPFESQDGKVPACRTFKRCKNSKPIQHYFAEEGTTRVFNDVYSIKNEIMNFGPLTTRMSVYRDFLAYSTGIYEHQSDEFVFGHAVELLGWGEENGVEYWILKNQWKNEWGENGFARIKIGDSDIAKTALAGQPDLGRL